MRSVNGILATFGTDLRLRDGRDCWLLERRCAGGAHEWQAVAYLSTRSGIYQALASRAVPLDLAARRVLRDLPHQHSESPGGTTLPPAA
jgi:hypothetical protein